METKIFCVVMGLGRLGHHPKTYRIVASSIDNAYAAARVRYRDEITVELAGNPILHKLALGQSCEECVQNEEY